MPLSQRKFLYEIYNVIVIINCGLAVSSEAQYMSECAYRVSLDSVLPFPFLILQLHPTPTSLAL
jgi:hypothetical protein